MADPKWFVESEYCANKVFQMNSMEYGNRADWDVPAFEAELAKFGVTPFQHFEATGNGENVSPNALFDVPQYLAAMAAHMNSYENEDGSIGYEGKTDWDEAGAAAELAEYGLSAWDHYTQTGMFEGLNPSNAFDTDAYCQAVADNMNATSYLGKTGWTIEDAKAEMQEFGYNPLQHYLVQGGPVENLAISEVPAEEQVTTTYNPYGEDSGEGEGGVTGADLTTENDVWVGTEGDDMVNGAVAAFSSETTLNPGDTLDGLGGNDTLNVSLNGNFAGFSNEEAMKNIENVVLENTGTTARTFNAKNIAGVESYTLKGNVSLSDVADAAAAINLEGQQKDVNIGFAADAVAGTDDTLNLGINGVGAADKAVTVTAEGFEKLAVTATGENYVDLTGVPASAVTVSGEGSLDAGTVTATSVDASALAGGMTLTAGDGFASFIGGAGDDVVTMDVSTAAKNATIRGGEGTNTLTLTGTGGTVKYATEGFQTLDVTTGAALTVEASGMQGLNTVNVGEDATGGVQIAKLGAVDMTLNLTESASVVSLDNSGAAAVNVSGATTSDVTLSQAGVVSAVVAEKADYSGTLTAVKAESVTVDVQGTLTDATVQADAATDISFTAVKNKSSVILAAAKAKSLSLQGIDADLTVSGALTSLASVEAAIGKATLTMSDVAAVQSISLSGEGSASFGALGSEKNSLEISAQGLENLTLGNITASSVGVNTEGLMGNIQIGNVTAADGTVEMKLDTLGTVAVGTITAAEVTVDASTIMDSTVKLTTAQADTVNFTGAEMVANSLTAAMNTGEGEINVTGGVGIDTIAVTEAKNLSMELDLDLGVDVVTITMADGATAALKLSGDLGGDGDTLTIQEPTNTDEWTVDLSGLSGYSVKLKAAENAANTFDLGAGQERITGTIDENTSITVKNFGEGDVLALDGNIDVGAVQYNLAQLSKIFTVDELIDGKDTGQGVVLYDGSMESLEKEVLGNISKDADTNVQIVFNNGGKLGFGILEIKKTEQNAAASVVNHTVYSETALEVTLSGIDFADLTPDSFGGGA